jgi:acyl transferase domain-containing protein/aryl carrier-like protein
MSESIENQEMTGSEIAVTGMAGRFPGAGNIHEFWENLKNGVETVLFLSGEELEKLNIDPGLVQNPGFVKTSGGEIENKEFFDASFFGYTPKEAEIMDPQIRIFHECVWEALEDSGYDPGGHECSIGLFAGASSSSFWEYITYSSGKSTELGYFPSSYLNNKDFLTSRIAYKLNLKGPSFTLQTACSTALVAIHLACQAILNGECEMALAGGINITPQKRSGYLFQEGAILSPDGHCRAFDTRAQGFIGGSGAGIVLLKLLEDAVTGRDHIYAVVKGTAVNNDGTRKIGFSAPSIEGQAEVIGVALKMAEVAPETIGYIETHGTGTVLGDPVEIQGLQLAFNTGKKGFCYIGSVKTNIGHLDAAAGAAGFIKTVLALKHNLIPPSLHFETPNPRIDFENSPFIVNTKLREWKNEKSPRRAGVSSLGIGGTNAHIILEEAPAEIRDKEGTRGLAPLSNRQYQLIVLSAKTQSALNKATENLTAFLQENPEVNMADAAYTLQKGRTAFPYRRMRVCSTRDDALETFSSLDFEKVNIYKTKEEERPVIFMFPGLGAQYVNMGIDIYRTEPVFREEMNRCFEILKPLIDYDIKEILYPGEMDNKSIQTPTSRDRVEPPLIGSPRRGVNRTDIAQVVIFIFEYALARLLMKWGIKPRALIGYSFGEYTAACISGVLSPEDALTLIVSRGKLIKKAPPGAMLSVPLTREKLKPLLDDELSIAIDNGPSCIVSGPCAAVEVFEKKMKEKRCICIRLQASHALHSNMMEPVAEEFEAMASRLTLNEPQIPYIANVTGSWMVPADALKPGYWREHLLGTVQFAKGIEELLKESNPVFVEIGPGHDLSVLCRHHVNNEQEQTIVHLIKHPREKIPGDYYLLNKVGQLWLAGVEIDWQRFYEGQRRCRLSLPTYPFERSSYWIEYDPLNMTPAVPAKSSPAKRADIADWFYIPSWKYSPLAVASGDRIPNESCWLLFIDDTGLGAQLAGELKNEGLEAITVTAGEQFAQLSAGEYTVNPAQNNDYNTLLKELSKIDRAPGRILHLWSFGGNCQKCEGQEYIDRLLTRGFYSLMYLARAIGKRDYKQQVQIVVIGDNMQQVTGEDVISPGKAAVLGAVKVIPQEYSNIDCRSLDIGPSGTADGQYKNTIRQLIMDCKKEFPHSMVAYRSHFRWVQIFEPVQLRETGGKTPSRLKKNGVYLVTGGLGGIGFTTAEYLAKNVRAKLVLTGRSTLPPRQEWRQWIDTHPPGDKTSRKIEKVFALEKMGGEVLVCSADVSHYRQMKEVIAAAEKRFGCINGVIHSAGIPDGGVIPLRKRETTDKILAPKVKGTCVLDEVLGDIELDFFIIYSSLASISGGLGQLGYCAANIFQDAYARYRSGVKNNFTVSINWDSWSDVGFGIEILNRLLESKDISETEAESWLMHAMSSSEGMDAFSRIIEYSFPQVIISTRDIKEINRPLEIPQTSAPGEEIPEKAPSGKLYPRPELSTEYVVPKTDFEKTCANILQQYFGFEKVGIHDNLFDFGVTSLEMIHINGKLQKELGKDIPLVIMFEFPTIHSLQQHLCREEMGEPPDEDPGNLEKEGDLLYGTIDTLMDDNEADI